MLLRNILTKLGSYVEVGFLEFTEEDQKALGSGKGIGLRFRVRPPRGSAEDLPCDLRLTIPGNPRRAGFEDRASVAVLAVGKRSSKLDRGSTRDDQDVTLERAFGHSYEALPSAIPFRPD